MAFLLGCEKVRVDFPTKEVFSEVSLGVGEETPLSDGDMSVREALAALKTAQIGRAHV